MTDHPSPDPSSRFTAAERLLEEFAARRAAGEPVDIDALVAAHPELAKELRALWSKLSALDSALASPSLIQEREAERVEDLLASLAVPEGSRYAVEAEIGRGGMGAVLRVRDRQLDRPLAMKVVLGQAEALRTGQTPGLDSRQLARFVNEAKLTGSLDHPGIVPVHEAGVDEAGRAYFTMKLVKGATLGDVLRRRSAGDPEWPLPRLLAVFERVCEAMSYAHARGVIHRDLKPANIMVGDYGEVYVMDWGLARRLGDASVEAGAAVGSTEADAELELELSLTREGSVMGTPAYMSPEQARGEISRMGTASDVYSLGAMLHEALAGHPPHMRRDERPSGYVLLQRVANDEVPRLAASEAPAELAAICEKALRREPAERYASVRELGADLQRFASGRVVSAYETGTWAETRKWVLRNKPLAGSLAAALVIAVAGVVAFDIKATEATKTADDVLLLSTHRDLDALQEEAQRLWPPHPGLIDAYEAWLARLGELAGDARSAATNGAPTSSLAYFRSRLAELRRSALPLDDEDLRLQREMHPRRAELEAKRKDLQWRRRMLGLEPWPPTSEAEAAVAALVDTDDPDLLRFRAWLVADPDRGAADRNRAGEAVIWASRSAALAEGRQRAWPRFTLAWSLHWAGRLDEAQSELAGALEDARSGGDLDALELELAEKSPRLRKFIDAWSLEQRPQRLARLTGLEAEIAALEAEIATRTRFEYADERLGWWDRQLAALVADLEATTESAAGLAGDGCAEPHGWGIARRLAFAREIRGRSIADPQAAAAWIAASAAIQASVRYGGLEVAPQMGLLPLGADPDSGLWEFAHLQSGEPASRGADGRLVLEEATGIVLVLVPGGRFLMGAQSADAARPGYDADSRNDNEGPVHEVELSPYFISKHELTQAQWRRIRGANPSAYSDEMDLKVPVTDMHPVESVTWLDCVETLRRLGLVLPTEAQWEHAARGGTTSSWWTGSDRTSLEGRANLADRTARERLGVDWPAIDDWPELDDGQALHGPVGAYPANPFGLHDTIGNVFEYCLDGYDARYYAMSARRDPLCMDGQDLERVARGGSYGLEASMARSAARLNIPPDTKDMATGLRPARRLDP